MVITNLRFIWYLDSDRDVNLSVGYNAIIKVEINSIPSTTSGNVSLLRLRAKMNKCKYEFKFKTLERNRSNDIFNTFQKICRSYEETRLYRDIKLRGAIISDKKLNILKPHEKVFNRYNNIWNLSKETGNIGFMYITNVRVVWYAFNSPNFNISIPYI